MRVVCLPALMVLIGFAAGCGKKPDSTGDKTGGDDTSALQGSWSVVKLDMGEEDEFTKGMAESIQKTVFTVNGDIVTVKDPKEAKGPTHFKLTIDASKSPKAIDFLPCDEKGAPKPGKEEKFNPATKKMESKEVPAESVLCIYKMEGDMLVVAVPVSFAQKSPRPTEFKVKVPKGKGKPEDDKESMVVLFQLKKK